MDEPLPSPPFIDVPGIANFRGVGGDHVAPGLVFRSADPSKATKAGLQKMSQDLGIRTIYDLRSLPEIQRSGPEWADVPIDDITTLYTPYSITRHWIPVFPEADYSPESVALRYQHYTNTTNGTAGFVQAYRDILNAGAPAYTIIFRHLAQKDGSPTPCLVHCTAGKDRTGVFVALLLMLAGATREEIADEYALTDLGLRELKPVFVERLLKNPRLGGREGVLNMVSSKRENMLDTVGMIEMEFGGVEGYLKDRCGLAEEEVACLRRNLTEGSLVGMVG